MHPKEFFHWPHILSTFLLTSISSSLIYVIPKWTDLTSLIWSDNLLLIPLIHSHQSHTYLGIFLLPTHNLSNFLHSYPYLFYTRNIYVYMLTTYYLPLTKLNHNISFWHTSNLIIQITQDNQSIATRYTLQHSSYHYFLLIYTHPHMGKTQLTLPLLLF